MIMLLSLIFLSFINSVECCAGIFADNIYMYALFMNNTCVFDVHEKQGSTSCAR